MTTRRDILTFALAAPAVILSTSRVMAASPDVFATAGTAIHGYDPVGYFTDLAPVDGNDAYRLKWMGAMWRFSNAANMAQFEADPRAFAPHYGGYCAYAMSKGAVATTVPEAWTIHEDKLYLNFSTGVRELWREDIPGNVAAADAHWPEALKT